MLLPMERYSFQKIYSKKLNISVEGAKYIFLLPLPLPIDSQGSFAQDLSKEGSIRVKAAKYDLQSSPLNRIISYLFIGFSGFSVLSSFLFISSFFGIISEERKASLGVLRAIGYSRHKMFSILFIEGLLYLIISEIVGALMGRWIWKIVSLSYEFIESAAR